MAAKTRRAPATKRRARAKYVSDPDDHAWEIAWNPAWAIDERGMVTFGL